VVDAVVFDLGGVLIDWNPRHLYRKLMPAAEVEEFLASVCTREWNQRQDAGRPVADAVAELVALHPDRQELIAAYYERWEEMVSGPVEGVPEILAELDRRGVPLYALSNWSAETFPRTRARFEFLGRFRGITLSGEEGYNKPDPRLYRALIDRYQLDPRRTLFIDDHDPNVEAARALGMIAIAFRDAAQLRAELEQLGLLGD
jgi:2-haloacid dehalogenase